MAKKRAIAARGVIGPDECEGECERSWSWHGPDARKGRIRVRLFPGSPSAAASWGWRALAQTKARQRCGQKWDKGAKHTVTEVFLLWLADCFVLEKVIHSF